MINYTAPLLLDLFCCAGGASMGYSRAGFEVTGVDIDPQPRYPFPFHQADAIEFLKAHGDEFDVIHASPPCQKFSNMTTGRWQDRVPDHPDLIKPIRELLIKLGKPYIIENVSGARAELINPFMLCGTMFQLQTSQGNQLLRHRYFESNFIWPLVPPCQHNKASAVGVYGGGQNPGRKRGTDPSAFGIEARKEAMGIDWMTGQELNESIPPAYTQFIGNKIMESLHD